VGRRRRRAALVERVPWPGLGGGWGLGSTASTGRASEGVSEGNGSLDVAAHGDPEFTGGRSWAAEAKGARSGFGKEISGANGASVSC
jgi:hypothetical protein